MQKDTRYIVASTVMIALFVGVMLFGSAAGEQERASRAPTKDIYFWLHYDPSSPTVNGQATQLSMNTSMYWQKTNYTIDGDKNLDMDFYIVPHFVHDVTLNGAVTIGFWGSYSGSNNNFQVSMTLSELNGAGTENWTGNANTFNYAPASSPQYYSFVTGNIQHTFGVNSTIHVSLTVTGGNGIYKAVYIDTTSNNSRLILPLEDYMGIDSINTYDAWDNPQTGFLATANNTTVKFKTTVSDPYGGYDVKWVNMSIIGPTGANILVNTTMNKTVGTPVSYYNTYETWWNYSGAAAGRYNITIFAVDNSGYYYYYYFMNYNFGNYSVNDTSFFFIGTMRYVNVKALDSMGVPLPDAEVQATLLDAVATRNITDLAGLSNLTMQPGPYFFKVFWQGMLVANEEVNVTDNRTDADPLMIYCWVYYPIFKAVDSHSVPLVDAAVYVHHPNGTASILPYHTNLTGEFNLTQTAMGPYAISVVWGSVEVNNSLVLVTGNETYTINCAVYYFTIKAVDPHGAPILNAQTVMIDNSTLIVADSKLSDTNGTAVFRLPKQRYDIRVYWYEAVIYEGWNEPLNADRSLTITCGIYYLTINAVDSRNLPIENALGVVSIAANSKVMDSKLSDAAGEIIIRLPQGYYNVSIFWQDVLVFEGAGVQVSADAPFKANCAVYYLTITAVDSHNQPVENAQIQVNAHAGGRLFDVQTTGNAGNVTCRLPATDLTITARWQDIIVNTTASYQLTGDGNLVLQCSVYYLSMTAVDSRGVAIQSATIKTCFAGAGKLLDVKTTDYDGKAVSRLPAADICIEVYWQDVLVNNTEVYTLSLDSDLTLNCRVYYLDILCIDSRNAPLDDAYVRVSLVGGRLVESPRTNETGIVTVRVPVGTVNVSVTWLNVPVAAVVGHMVENDHLLTVTCSVYYVDVRITDSQDKMVSNAQVSFYRTATGKRMDTRMTGTGGNVTFRMPAEQYGVTVYWQDQLVSPDTSFTVTKDDTLTIKCMIYYITITAVDSQNKVLENATVMFRQDLTGNILDTRVTNQNGVITARLPVGRHSIFVTWKDVQVNETLSYELTADATLTVNCRVFYLTVTPLDVQNIFLANAEVTIAPQGRPEAPTSLVTDAQGRGVFRLPAQPYDLKVRWKGVEVCVKTGYGLTGDASLSLTCRVYYLTVKVTDKDGKALEGVTLTVYNTRNNLVIEVFDSALTNSSSRGIFRLPFGDYRVVGRLKTTYLMTPVDMTKSKSLNLQDSTTVKMVFSEYPLPIHTTNAFLLAVLIIMLVVAMVGTMYYIYKKFGQKTRPAPASLFAGTDGGAPSGAEGETQPVAGEADEEKGDADEPEADKDGDEGEEPKDESETEGSEEETKDESEDGEEEPAEDEEKPAEDEKGDEPAAEKPAGEKKDDAGDLDDLIKDLKKED
jgi:hypothetical protein